MAWRSELNYISEGTADQAWEEDLHASPALKSVSNPPGCNLTAGHLLSNEAVSAAFEEGPWLAAGNSCLAQQPLVHGASSEGVRKVGQNDCGAVGATDWLSNGLEMKRKGGLSSPADVDGSNLKKAQKQTGPGLEQGKGSTSVPAAPEFPNAFRAGESTDIPALRDAASPPRRSRSSLLSCPAGGSQHCSSPTSMDSAHPPELPSALSEAPALLLTDLPPALLLEVLSHLRAHDLSVVACVSRLFRGLAAESQGWKHFYCERWRPARPLRGMPTEPAELHVASHGRSWKELYVEREERSSSLLGTFRADMLHGHTAPARTVKILPGSSLVASGGYDRSVRLWDLDTGMPIAATAPLDETVRSVAVDHDSLAAGTSDGAIRVWHASSECPHLFDLSGLGRLGALTPASSPDRWWGHGGPVSCLAIEEGRLYSGSWDMTAKVWATVASSDAVLQSFSHRDWLWALAVRGGTLLTAAGPDVYRWDVETGRLLTLRQRVHGQAHAVQGTRSGHFTFTAGDNGAVLLFDERLPRRKACESGWGGGEEAVVVWRPHGASINALAFEDPWLVTASSDSQLAMLDARGAIHGHRRGHGHTSGNKPRAPAGPSAGPEVGAVSRRLGAFSTAALCVDIDGVRVVAGGEGPSHVLKVWDFSQALEIERRVQASRSSRQRQRQKKRQDNQDAAERASPGSPAGGGGGKNESGRGGREGRLRQDVHPRAHVGRPPGLLREPLAKMNGYGERSKERSKGRGSALIRGAERTSADGAWQVKGRGR